MYEPHHLLKFAGDSNLQFCYRYLVPNVHSKGINSGLGCCGACNAALSVHDGPRLKPLRKMTKAIQKLMNKSAKKIPLSRFENFKLKKFMESPQQMVVRCSECGYVDKKPVSTRQELIKIKDDVAMSAVEELEEEPEPEPEVKEKTKRKRKKKKKQKEKVRKNPNSLLTDSEEEDKDKNESAKTPLVNLSTPMTSSQSTTPCTNSNQKAQVMSVRKFIKSETKDTSSTTIFENAVNSAAKKSLLPPSQQQQQQTPFRPNKNQKKSTDKLSKSMSSLSKRKSTLIHKQLKSFLSDKTKDEEKNKSPSLMDFLTSL